MIISTIGYGCAFWVKSMSTMIGNHACNKTHRNVLSVKTSVSGCRPGFGHALHGTGQCVLFLFWLLWPFRNIFQKDFANIAQPTLDIVQKTYLRTDTARKAILADGLVADAIFENIIFAPIVDFVEVVRLFVLL